MEKEWRTHPKLKGKLLEDYPDDLQVIVHDGGPRLTINPPELVWVRVMGVQEDLFFGVVLNQPHHLQLVEKNSPIMFLVSDHAPYPIQVRASYLQERPDWMVHPCSKCGNNELLDAPSDLIKVIFPNLPSDSELEMFSTFCGLCGGVQVVENQKLPGEM
ncbi:MAG: hypothetical protein K1Y36_14165 [Blastocatellia bacterium]|nr:hypothetical protein [Blastocatellia bacterium]